MNVSWKDVLHYGSAAVLVVIGVAGMMGLHVPGVTIDPTVCFATAAGVFGAGLKGGWSSAPKAAMFLSVAIGLSLSLILVPAHAETSWSKAQKNAAIVVKTPAPAPAPGAQLTTTQVQRNPLLLLQAFSVGDLQNAIALANAQTPPDTVAATCYTDILNVVQSIAAPTAPSGDVGAFTGVQVARDAKAMALNLLSPTGPLVGISNACAPLVMDAQNTLIGLGVTAGLVANPVGGAAAVAGLPAAVAAFLAALPKF